MSAVGSLLYAALGTRLDIDRLPLRCQCRRPVLCESGPRSIIGLPSNAFSAI